MNISLRLIVIITSAFVIVLGAYELLRVKVIKKQFSAVSIAQGLSTGTMMRVEVMRYYNDYGELPESNDDARLADEKEYANDVLDSAGIGKAGVITLVYNKKSGMAGGTVQLVPVMNDKTHYLHWDCRSSSFPTIQEFMPQCHYRPTATTVQEQAKG